MTSPTPAFLSQFIGIVEAAQETHEASETESQTMAFRTGYQGNQCDDSLNIAHYDDQKRFRSCGGQVMVLVKT